MRKYGTAGDVILPQFRKIAKTHVTEFMNAKDRVYDLLGSKQNAESGKFREELLRRFLRDLLPAAVAVDTGFIYGFEQVPTSDQLDIIVWHKAAHSPVYDAGSVVIVPPEAVIAVVSVKSKMTLSEVESGLKNLMSIAPLDYAFRSNLLIPGKEEPLPSISKFLVFYSQPEADKSIVDRISTVTSGLIASDPEIETPLKKALQNVDPVGGVRREWEHARRGLPLFIATIEPGNANFVQGWGPPDDHFGTGVYGDGMRRVPWIYRSASAVTSSLEKMVYLLLRSVFECLGSPAMTTLSSWADMQPDVGMRVGNVMESVYEDGAPLIAYK